MAEKSKRRNAKPKSSPEVVRAVFYDVKFSRMTLTQIAAKHKISGTSLISKWIKKYSSDFEDMSNVIPLNDVAGAIPTELALKAALDKANMKIISLETMIDLAEKELNLDIRKKSGTKQ